MTRVLSLCVCLAALTATPAFAQSPNASISSRIAFFSPSRAFAESSDGKAATARLTALEADRARAARDKEAALEKLERSLEQSTAVLSEAARGAAFEGAGKIQARYPTVHRRCASRVDGCPARCRKRVSREIAPSHRAGDQRQRHSAVVQFRQRRAGLGRSVPGCDRPNPQTRRESARRQIGGYYGVGCSRTTDRASLS